MLKNESTLDIRDSDTAEKRGRTVAPARTTRTKMFQKVSDRRLSACHVLAVQLAVQLATQENCRFCKKGRGNGPPVFSRGQLPEGPGQSAASARN